MENSEYLFAVFGLVWLVLFIYIWILLGAQKRLQRQINILNKRIQDKELNKQNT